MSITDPIEIIWDTKRGKYYLQRGRETFYDAVTHEWIMFDTEEQAKLWRHIYLKVCDVALAQCVYESEGAIVIEEASVIEESSVIEGD